MKCISVAEACPSRRHWICGPSAQVRVFRLRGHIFSGQQIGGDLSFVRRGLKKMRKKALLFSYVRIIYVDGMVYCGAFFP